MMSGSEPDHLQSWWRVRSEVPWATVSAPILGPVPCLRDGLLDHVRDGATRGPDRAARLERALVAARGTTVLDFEELSAWQALVLGRPESFRTGPAFAKGGRERYGLSSDTFARFRSCLEEANDRSIPLPSRAARVYLDVCFVHPFPDGNGRAAFLSLAHLLHREQVEVDQIAPATNVARHADDRSGAIDLVRLLQVLIRGSRRRAKRVTTHGHSPPPWRRERPPAGCDL